MSVFQTIQGTSTTEFRIGLTGPTIYSGTADPTVTPPTPLADGFRDGDIYFRTATGGAALWVIDNGGTWTQIASGASGGTFGGDIIMNPSAQFLGDPAAGAGAPAYGFNTDTDTGMFNPNPDEIGFTVGGTQVFVIEADGTLASTTAGYESLVLADNDIPNRKYVEDTFINGAGDNMTGDLTFDPGTQLFLATGSAADPGISFALNTDSGIFSDEGFATDAFSFSAGGSPIMTVRPGGLEMRSGEQFFADTGVVGAPGYAFAGDEDTGIWQEFTGEMQFALDGVEVIELNSTALETNLLWRGPNGSVGAPAISFFGDDDTGIYTDLGDELSFAAGGADALVLDTDSVTVSTGHDLVLTDSGAQGTPTLYFLADSTTGLFSSGAGALNITTAGTEVGRFSGDQLLMVDGAAGAPAYSFTGETNTGMFRSAAGQLSFSVLGTNQILLDGNALNSDQQVRVNPGNQGSGGPAFSFTSDTDSGLYSGGANEVGISTGGTGRWEWKPNGDFEPTGNNTYNIGDTGARVATVYATTFDGTATAAQYSDLAERYTVGDCCELEPGDVVVICECEDHDICLSGEKEGDTAVLGVVSTAPAFMMNKDAGDDQTAPYIALRGRVPVKVCGDVKKGDLLIACGDCDCHEPCAGHARALKDWEKSIVEYTHSVFAKALRSHDGQHGDGVVEAVIL